MTQVIIFKNNGGVAVCYPTGELSMEQVMNKDIPANCGARIVQESDLPLQYNDFFEAWEMDETSVTVNLNKAKEITKKRLREERVPLLLEQDILFQRALETGIDTSLIIAEKERLRDITKLVDNCNTLEELKTIKLIN